MNNTPQLPNLLSKGIVAKLLATENITMVVGSYETASFDTEKRVLYFPLFNNTVTQEITDMLIGHEVGHALWSDSTKTVDFLKSDIPFAYLNIVEDIRIERLIQKRFPGLISRFTEAYKQLVTRDFFKLNGVDLSSLNLADRLNIHAKVGAHYAVPFSPEEKAFFDRCYAAETMDEVIGLAKELHKIIGARKEGKKPDSGSSSTPDHSAPNAQGQQEEGMSEDDSMDSSSTDEGGEKSESADDSEDSAEGAADGNSGEDSDDTADSDCQNDSKDDSKSSEKGSHTDVAAKGPVTPSDKSDYEGSRTDRKFSDDKNNLDSRVTVVNFPSEKTLGNYIIPYSELKKSRKKTGIDIYDDIKLATAKISEMASKKASIIKTNATVMANEFISRRAAHNYQRTANMKTGRVDTNRLHQYKTSEDIFSTLSISPDETNHGMIMFIDYSGSMSGTISGVIEQVLTMCQMCKQVSIPFVAYGFNSLSAIHSYRREEKNAIFTNRLPYEIILDPSFAVFEVISSELSSKDYKDAFTSLLHYAVGYKAYGSSVVAQCFPISPYESLGATPLNEAVMVAHRIAKEFRRDNNIEKLSVVFLTDGEGSNINVSVPYCSVGCGVFYGKQINNLNGTFECAHKLLIENLRKSIGCKVIGFYLNPNFRRFFENDTAKSMSRELRDNGFTTAARYNYDEYFFVGKPNECTECEDDVETGKLFGKSHSQIAKLLTQEGRSEKASKGLLRKLSQIIAK